MVDTTFNNAAISALNQLRARHGCPPVTYDSSLARSAQLWAEEIASTKCMRHSDQETYGENLAYKGALKDAQLSADEAVNMWYEQINFHDFDEEFTYETSYFTQLVWKSTNLVGFGRAIATDGTAAYVVAHFKPKGNVRGLFNANVPFARPSSAISTDLLNRRSEANSVVSHREETKKEKKEREKAEKEERKRLEKLRKEREKMEKKAQKEREKQEKLEKKEQRKSLKSEVKLR